MQEKPTNKFVGYFILYEAPLCLVWINLLDF
jgi:hypothetical protein